MGKTIKEMEAANDVNGLRELIRNLAAEVPRRYADGDNLGASLAADVRMKAEEALARIYKGANR